MLPATTNVTATETVFVGHEKDIMLLVTLIRQHASLVGLTSLDQTKLITATSELTRNMLNYADKGQVIIDQLTRGNQRGVQLTFADNGPGIADIDQAMEDGYSSGLGLGLGLPGAKRLMDEFHIASVVGQGTTVTIAKWTDE
ncbi:anti-sigma regulatory factor [Spirosoma luteum]|uniref:anti-sigma regulatory factor n=1 Tax=Spirosoma luteum TaxID=431553 RepID=UPI000362A775|nr:anti-sigma regulatory factor [Spirosoma luteum]